MKKALKILGLVTGLTCLGGIAYLCYKEAKAEKELDDFTLDDEEEDEDFDFDDLDDLDEDKNDIFKTDIDIEEIKDCNINNEDSIF